MQINLKKYKKGFTLIETLIYASIFVVMLVVTLAIIVNLSDTFKRVAAHRIVESEVSNTMERIVRDVRQAISVDVVNSTFTIYPGVLQLILDDGLGGQKTVKYYLDNGIIYLDEDGAVVGPLTSDKITITDFKFFNITTSNSDAVRTTITATITLKGETITKTIYNLGVLRN